MSALALVHVLVPNGAVISASGRMFQRDRVVSMFVPRDARL